MLGKGVLTRDGSKSDGGSSNVGGNFRSSRGTSVRYLLVIGPRKQGGIERPAAGVLVRARTEYDERAAVKVENSDKFIVEVRHTPSRFWPWQSSKSTRAATLTRTVSETPSLFKTLLFLRGSPPADK
jgi:hypothetical protein